MRFSAAPAASSTSCRSFTLRPLKERRAQDLDTDFLAGDLQSEIAHTVHVDQSAHAAFTVLLVIVLVRIGLSPILIGDVQS